MIDVVDATQKPFHTRGGATRLMKCRDPEILIEGPAGTGKSRAALEKLYLACLKYPDIRVLVARKTAKSITQSVRVTFEEKVATGFPPLKLHGQKQQYDFPNGSKIVLAGLNEPERIKSAEYDIIYVNEGTELDINDYEILLSRNRNWQMPYQQTIVDCNPDAPGHWLNKRAETVNMTRILSRHEDNPLLFDEKGEVTPAGAQYMSILDSLTGVRKERLRYGKWVAAEGMIFSEWKDEYLVPQFRIPKDWPRYLAVDFGFTDPFVCQWWAWDREKDILYLYREVYHTRKRVEEHAHRIFEQSSNETFNAIITDHDAEDRATLERHITHKESDCPGEFVGIKTVGAKKAVEGGLQLVKMRMAKGGIKIFRDAIVDIDPMLRDYGKPYRTIDEIPNYVWDQVQSQRLGERNLDLPRKKDDHGMDPMRYLVMHVDDPNAAALKQLFSGPHSMTIRNQTERMSNRDQWIQFFGK